MEFLFIIFFGWWALLCLYIVLSHIYSIKVRVVTQGSHVIIQQRQHLLWKTIKTCKFDPEAYGSHGEALEHGFKLAGDLRLSLQYAKKVEIEL